MRRFRLDRLIDESGVSGTGCVAQGIVFEDGTCVLRWLTKHKSTAVYQSIDDLLAIHGHGGRTALRFDDPMCFRCGAHLFEGELDRHRSAGHCTNCGAGNTPLYFEAHPNPSLGSWSPALRSDPKGGAEK